MRTEGPFFGARLSPVPHAWMGRFRNRNRSPLVRASVDPCGRTRGIRAWCFHVILPAAKFVIAEGMVEGQTVGACPAVGRHAPAPTHTLFWAGQRVCDESSPRSSRHVEKPAVFANHVAFQLRPAYSYASSYVLF